MSPRLPTVSSATPAPAPNISPRAYRLPVSPRPPPPPLRSFPHRPCAASAPPRTPPPLHRSLSTPRATTPPHAPASPAPNPRQHQIRTISPPHKAGIADQAARGELPKEVRPPSAGPEDEEEEEGDVCRTCRNRGDEDHPLQHPRACSGSIKFVTRTCSSSGSTIATLASARFGSY